MPLERNDVRFPLWRKKVDLSLVHLGYTPIPNWVARLWSVPTLFAGVQGKRDPAAKVEISFKGVVWSGWIVPHRQGAAFRLFMDPALRDCLSQTFVMTYLRGLEDQLRRRAGPLRSAPAAENDIPFWEFLDLEFDETSRRFVFVAHFVQASGFPRLFERLIGSPPLRHVRDALTDPTTARIQKRGWRPKADYPFEVGARNVIYMLADMERRKLYVGEAEDLIARFTRGHSGMPEWTHYRYDLLPDELAPYRVMLERMLICDIDSLIGAWSQALPERPGGFTFVNLKIDR